MHVLCIGGTDSSGGAGVQRDALTVAALGATPYSVITAVTAQSNSRVWRITPMSVDCITAQLHAACDTAPPCAIKIGMLATLPSVRAVVAWLSALPQHVPVVLDPVLCSSSGARLLSLAGQRYMLQHLLPLVTLITPNLPEYTALGLMNTAVLLKGGHATGDTSDDVLYQPAQKPQYFSAPRLQGNMRGTGCMLASAIAVGLARGQPLAVACAHAKTFVWQQLAGVGAESPSPVHGLGLG